MTDMSVNIPLQVLDTNPDALLLYIFYCTTSKLQETSTVYTSDRVCKESLNWGYKRFQKAKNFLQKEAFITPVTKRYKSGVIQGHYIKVHPTPIKDNIINQPKIIKPKDPPPIY